MGAEVKDDHLTRAIDVSYQTYMERVRGFFSFFFDLTAEVCECFFSGIRSEDQRIENRRVGRTSGGGSEGKTRNTLTEC